MSVNVLLFFAAVLVYARAEGNELCSCDNNEQEKNMLNLLLEKLSSDVNEDEKLLYSVYPGLLKEFSCDCEEKQRMKRKILPEPEQVGNSEEVVKRSIHWKDRRCPEGTVRFISTCVNMNDLLDYN